MLSWLGENWVALASLIALIIGGISALLRWRESNKLKRSEFIEKFVFKFREDKEMQETIYHLDYGKSWYGENFHSSNSEMQSRIDRLFIYINYICYLKDTKIIKNEFSMVEYVIVRICKQLNTRAYLWNVYHFSQKNGVDCSFKYMIKFLLKNILTESERISFQNKQSEFPKYLNF